jgi:hypothetical protein
MCLALASAAAAGGAALDAKVSGDPANAAEKAFQSGDRRHIVVPVCGADSGEVLPGWPLQESPAHRDALERGQRPFMCSDFGDDPKHHNFMRAAKYAERHNRRLLELEGKGSR